MSKYICLWLKLTISHQWRIYNIIMEDTFFYPTTSILMKPLSDPQLRYIHDFTDCFAARVQNTSTVFEDCGIDNFRNMTNSLWRGNSLFLSAAVSLTAWVHVRWVCKEWAVLLLFWRVFFHPVMFDTLSILWRLRRKKVWEKDDYRENKAVRRTDRKTAYLLWIRWGTTWITGSLNESNMLQPEKKRKKRKRNRERTHTGTLKRHGFFCSHHARRL